MPRYYFHVHDGTTIWDRKGTDLPDLRQARRVAVQVATSHLSEAPEHFWNGDDWHLDVTNATGLTLFTLHFMAVDAPSIRGASGGAGRTPTIA